MTRYIDAEVLAKLEAGTILAIDPGNIQSAWVLLDSETLRPVKFAKQDNDAVLQVLTKQADPSTPVVIEMIASYGMPVGREVFDTCVWIGRYVQVAQNEGADTYFIYRQEEKLNLCHSPKAKDGNIRQALIDRFGPVGTKKNPGWFYGVSKDVWAAIAVGVTWADKQREGSK